MGLNIKQKHITVPIILGILFFANTVEGENGNRNNARFNTQSTIHNHNLIKKKAQEYTTMPAVTSYVSVIG